MRSRIRFVTIGYIEWRKGQDILIDAIERLPDEVAQQSEFALIGQNTSLMAADLVERISAMTNVSMPGTLSREDIHMCLDDADVLICPSREDPMPTVCAEAMMHKLPCLVSDAAGTSAYIKDGYDGLIFKSGDVSDLTEKIMWCTDHKDELKEMGNRAYHIYKQIFSEEAFGHNILLHVEEMLSRV